MFKHFKYTAALLASLSAASSAQADIVHGENVLIDSSAVVGNSADRLCIGDNCIDGEVYSHSYTKLRLKDESLSIEFVDPTPNDPDWEIRANDTSIAGFEIREIGSSPSFYIQGGAPANALFVGETGKIGLGTTLPQSQLHIVAPLFPSIRLERTSSPVYSWGISGNNANFFVQDVTGGTIPLIIEDGAPSNSLNIESNGNVGLGTSAPEEKLHIQTTANNTDAFALFDAAGTGSDAAFLLRQQGTVATTWEFRNQQSSGRLNVGIAGGNTPFKIDDAANNNLFKLGLNGQPDAVLVTGRLLVNNAELNVPDYVFGEDYALRPLADLRRFIDANSHLPEVPSAADIARDGVDMTEMQMTLLKKVEELTLYTIAQDDVIEDLLARLVVLEE